MEKSLDNFISDAVNQYVMTVHETQERFIFETIGKFAEDNYGIVVEKDELVCALQLIKELRERGIDCRDYYDAYKMGFENGINYENRCVEIFVRED